MCVYISLVITFIIFDDTFRTIQCKNILINPRFVRQRFVNGFVRTYCT